MVPRHGCVKMMRSTCHRLRQMRMQFKKLLVCLLMELALVLFFVSSVAHAVVVPSLDYFLIDVNDETRVVHPGEVLQVVRGDTVTVKKAVLNGSGRESEVVNFTGYIRPRSKVTVRNGTPQDDRKTPIDTGESLSPKQSVDGKGKRYRIVAKGMTQTYGTAEVELLDPEFRFAEVLVNRQLRIVRLGDTLDVAPTDSIKVRRVVTNVFDLRTVRFQIETKAGVSQIQLFRGSNVFARIPLSAPLGVPKSEPSGAAR